MAKKKTLGQINYEAAYRGPVWLKWAVLRHNQQSNV